MEFLECSTVKKGLNVFTLCLNFQESQPIYAYKHYAYKKECIEITFDFSFKLGLTLKVIILCYEKQQRAVGL